MPKVPLGKVEPPGGDPMMTEYVVMHVLRFHRDMPAYQISQSKREWRRARIVRPEERRVGFLGYGMMAQAPAAVLRSLGFKVSAWVRTPRPAGDIAIFRGPDQLEPFLNQTDIAVCLLPLTRETEGILCARTFAMMPKGAMLVNVGRGKHVVDKDLIAALDSGQLAYAALDALWPEPLPPESPLWSHPRVTIMPHVARRPTVAQLVARDGRQHPQPRGGRAAPAGSRRRIGLLMLARRRPIRRAPAADARAAPPAPRTPADRSPSPRAANARASGTPARRECGSRRRRAGAASP